MWYETYKKAVEYVIEDYKGFPDQRMIGAMSKVFRSLTLALLDGEIERKSRLKKGFLRGDAFRDQQCNAAGWNEAQDEDLSHLRSERELIANRKSQMILHQTDRERSDHIIDSFAYAVAMREARLSDEYVLLHVRKRPWYIPHFIFKLVLSKVLVLNRFRSEREKIAKEDKNVATLEIWCKDGIAYKNGEVVGEVYEDGQKKATKGEWVHLAVRFSEFPDLMANEK